MYICPEIQVIYLAQPRTASRSCVAFLKANTPVRTVGSHHDMDDAELKFRTNDGWRIVVAVRNHFDILVSWWHHNPNWFSRPKSESGFDYFVRDFTTGKGNQYAKPHAMYGRYQPLATHIMRYENLWDDLSDAVRIPAPLEGRPHIGPSDRNPYPMYYDDKTRAYVEGYYAKEMEKYGYGF